MWDLAGFEWPRVGHDAAGGDIPKGRRVETPWAFIARCMRSNSGSTLKETPPQHKDDNRDNLLNSQMLESR